MRNTRPISWIKAARKAFEKFPAGAQDIIKDALTIAAVWVLHAFQKKSKTGIKTPQQEVDIIHARLKRLKEELS